MRVGVPTSLQDANHAATVRFYSFPDVLGRGGFGANRSSARIRCRVRSVVLRPLATGRCYPPREAAHRPRSNGALLNQAYSRCLPPTRRRSRHRLRRRRPRGALRIQLRGEAQQMRQETLQNAARRCSAANTTAVCRGCFVGNPGTTPGIAHGL